MRADIALHSAASAASAGLRRARLMTLDSSELLKILDSRSAFVTCDLIAQRLLITDVIIHFVVRHNLNFSSSSSPDPLSDLTSVRTFNDLPEWSVSHFVPVPVFQHGKVHGSLCVAFHPFLMTT